MSETLLERNQGILRRAEDLGPIAERVRAVLERGKRDQLLAGVDAAGSAYPPLADATLRRRKGRDPRPLIALGEASGLIVGYTVDVSIAPGKLTVSAGWPGRPELQYLRTGTRRMPARDPGGFRAEDLDEIRRLLRERVVDGR